MTHDELLAKIDAAIDKRKRIYGTIGTRSPEIPRVLTDYHNTGISFLLALHAVVKYHKPCDNGATLLDYNGPIFGNCEGCRRAGVRVKWESCHTIILIQKELG